MIETRILQEANKERYIDFLAEHFTESIPPENIRASAGNEIDVMFSDYFRKPVFYEFWEGDDIVGSSGVIREWTGPDTWSLFWVCSHKEKRGQGIGRFILERTIEEFSSTIMKGKPGTLILSALEHNCPFYEQFGFDRGPKGHNWFIMSKVVNV